MTTTVIVGVSHLQDDVKVHVIVQDFIVTPEGPEWRDTTVITVDRGATLVPDYLYLVQAGRRLLIEEVPL